jgi:hypothetical protein
MIRQAGQHVGEPRLWIDVVELGGGDEGVDRSRTPPSSGPAKVQFFLPTATARSSRSAALFDMQSRPSSRKRVNASQRLECAPSGGQFHAAVLTVCRAW